MKLVAEIDAEQARQVTAYGRSDYKHNLLYGKEGLYARLGNAILRELREYDKTITFQRMEAQAAAGSIPTETDLERGLAQLEDLADRGNSFACNELGFIYLKGEFTAVDRRKARDWFQRSAQSGNQVGVWMIRHWQGSTILPHIRKDIQCTRDIRGGRRMLEYNLQRNYEKVRNLREAEILQEEIASRSVSLGI